MISLVVWLVWGQSLRPVVFEPRPLEPPASRLTVEGVLFRTSSLRGSVRSLSPRMFGRYLRQNGADHDLIRESEGAGVFDSMVMFSLRLENRGAETLLVNSDQILLMTAKGEPIGVLVDMADFWPQSLPQARQSRQDFAKVFARGTIELGPGRSSEQLLVFRPIGKRFPRHLVLRVNRVYYGIENVRIACGFNIRYPK